MLKSQTLALATDIIAGLQSAGLIATPTDSTELVNNVKDTLDSELDFDDE